jgi:mannose-6-phosphate isomerase
LEQAIHEMHADELLNWINIYPGEMIYIAGGTVHTLGPGSVLVETQQQSDTTYRLYDYGRPRELHLTLGLAAVKERVASGKLVRPAPSAINGTKNRYSPLVAAPFFAVDMFELKEPHTFRAQEASGKTSVVIPASQSEFRVRPQWAVEFLKARVPGELLPEPATRM